MRLLKLLLHFLPFILIPVIYFMIKCRKFLILGTQAIKKTNYLGLENQTSRLINSSSNKVAKISFFTSCVNVELQNLIYVILTIVLKRHNFFWDNQVLWEKTCIPCYLLLHLHQVYLVSSQSYFYCFFEKMSYCVIFTKRNNTNMLIIFLISFLVDQ